MADGFQGAGYIDPVTGQWVDTPGMSLNSTPQGGPLATARPITTPNSSTGQPAYAEPAAPTWQPQWQNPASKGQLTPASRTGAPAPGPPTIENAAANDPTGYSLTGRSVGPAIGGAALLAGAPTTDQGVYNNANAFNDWFNGTSVGRALNAATGAAQPRWGPAPSNNPIPVTQTGNENAVPPPGVGMPPPPNNGGPRGPVPPYLPPIGPRYVPASPIPGRPPVGALAQPGAASVPGGPQVAAPPAPSMVDLGHYRATVGNARGNPTWVPGGEDAPAPQIFRGATTAFGNPNYGAGPRGAQNYYQPGSAPMAPGDWTGTGPAAGPFVPPNVPSAAAQPMAAGRGGAPSGFAPNAAMMNNAALGDRFMGGNAFAGGNPYGQTGRGAPPARPGGFGFNPLNFFGAGP